MTFLNVRALLPLLAICAIVGCKQTIPPKVNQDPVFGKIQEIKTVNSEKQLMYQSGQDTSHLNWGTATSYYVRVDDVWYPLQWDEAAKMKDLKVGDSVNLHPSEFIDCIGENDLKPNCRRLMRVYKGDKPVAPLNVVQ